MTETTSLPTSQPSETPAKRLANLFKQMVRENDRRDALKRMTAPVELLLGLTQPAYQQSASHAGSGK
jgi:hypothetical protein